MNILNCYKHVSLEYFNTFKYQNFNFYIEFKFHNNQENSEVKESKNYSWDNNITVVCSYITENFG